MKKIALTLLSLFLITPCLANIHINPSTVESVVKEFVPADKVVSVISEYNNQLKSSNGAGISAQKLWNICAIAGWDIKQPSGKSQCQKFVNALVKKSSIKFYHACAKENKGKAGYICVDDFFTDKIYGGTQVNLTPGQTLAKEYARLKHNDSTVQCRNNFDPGTLDDTLMCTSHNQNAYYEFVFDDLEEPKDQTIKNSIQNAICRMYDAKPTTAGCAGGGTNVSGTATCWSASCAADSAKCAKINQSMAKFGYTAEYKNGKCEINFNTISKQEDLKTAYGIDNFVFCHGIQVANAPNVETYLKQYVAQRAGVSASSVKCDSGFNTYTGTGCTRNGITDFKDDIKTCRVGNNQIDFVFDDINEKWKKTVAGGVQGMSCIVTGGTYSGKRCIGLGEQQCEVLRKSNLKECPECKAAKWDDETQSCILPSSQSVQNLQKGINIALIAGGAVVGVVITVATAGTGTAIVLTAIETVGSAIELTSQLKINAIADDFLIKSNQCKNSTCAKEMLSQNLQRMSNYHNEMTAAEADAVDAELERLANLIPANDEIWATILVNGTDMADNRLSFFDIDSWEPEQIWRAVGIGLQLTSVVTSIGEWALKKSGRLAKSTATINAKFTAAVDGVDRAQDGALTGNRLALKRKIAQMRAAGAADDLDETEVIWRELHRKYAPRNQSLDDFKAMTNGNLEEMRQMAKNWTSWDLDEEMRVIQQKIDDIWDANPSIAESWYKDPRATMKEYPELAELVERRNQLNSEGFVGNYSTIDPNAKKIKATAQQNITLQKSMTETEVNMLRKQGYSEQEIDRLYTKIVEDTRKYTTDDVLRETAEQITISQLDDVALMRADQMHDIIESDSWLKSQKQNWYNLTTNEKREFAQEVSNKLLRKNGVAYDKTTEIRAAKLEIGNAGSYNKRTNVTQIDFDQVQDYESFIDVLAHENGGHAIDNLNPNAGALGAQLQDATHDLYGAAYDAYRAKPTEQTSWRIGEVSSVVNSYDNSDLTDVLLDAVDLNKRIRPLDTRTGGSVDYKALGTKSPVSALWDDLFDSKAHIALEIQPGVENADDIINVLQQSGKFKVSSVDGYWYAFPIK